MKRTFELLSSMQFTTVILAVLVFWFAWGILLAESPVYEGGFKIMNSVLVPVWFSGDKQPPLLLKVWFVGLCSGMLILAVNLVFCSWNKLIRLMKGNVLRSRMVMLVIHVVFGLVALGHFGSFLLGYRYENILLRKGQSFSLPQGYTLAVREIHFKDDMKLLNQSPNEHVPLAVLSQGNFCEVAFLRNGETEAQGRAYFMKPFVWKDIQVTLKRFTPPKGKKGPEFEGRTPSVRLIVSRNPVKGLVLFLFPVMIAGIALYLMMTWRSGGGGNHKALWQEPVGHGV